jgi:predicted Zn-dependent protease
MPLRYLQQKETNTMTTLSRRLFLSLGATAAYAVEPKVTVPAYNTLTDADEVALGRKFAGALEKDYPILDVAPLTDYINSIVAELGRTSRRPNIRFSAKVVNTTDVNASALLGGFVFVHRGLLETARNESELVGVLAHEVGHVAGRHSANRLMLNLQARRVYEVVKQNVQLQNTVVEQVIERLGGAAVVLASLKYGREMELEADMLGFYNLIRSGWNPNGILCLFNRASLANKGNSGDWLESVLSTHPEPSLRAQRIKAEIESIRMPADLRNDSVSFQAMKLGLKFLPPPVRPKAR